jgi:hypothetical protein
MLIRRTCTPLDQRRALPAFAVGIGAGVERVLQDRDDAAITNRRPRVVISSAVFLRSVSVEPDE